MFSHYFGSQFNGAFGAKKKPAAKKPTVKQRGTPMAPVRPAVRAAAVRSVKQRASAARSVAERAGAARSVQQRATAARSVQQRAQGARRKQQAGRSR